MFLLGVYCGLVRLNLEEIGDCDRQQADKHFFERKYSNCCYKGFEVADSGSHKTFCKLSLYLSTLEEHTYKRFFTQADRQHENLIKDTHEEEQKLE